MSRTDDPVIKRLLQTLREANVQNPDYDEIKRILEEGVDGRYLQGGIMNMARIRCDSTAYALPEGNHVGTNLRAFFNVAKNKHLWLERDGDDVLVEKKEEIQVVDGARFYTAFKKINGG